MQEFSVVNEVKKLGHIIRSDLCDGADVQRQYCKLQYMHKFICLLFVQNHVPTFFFFYRLLPSGCPGYMLVLEILCVYKAT